MVAAVVKDHKQLLNLLNLERYLKQKSWIYFVVIQRQRRMELSEEENGKKREK